MIKIAASILASDLCAIGADIYRIADAGADWTHFDVMDGAFVPNISFGPALVKALKKNTKLPLDVHLMINNPEKHIEQFAQMGADYITIHAEATNHLQRALSQIRSLGVKAGVSLCPSTPINVLQYVLDDIDLVLIMTVNPGFGGQSLIPATIKKVHDMRHMLSLAQSNAVLQVDGGINLETGKKLIGMGADCLVVGTALFSSSDPRNYIQALKGTL